MHDIFSNIGFGRGRSAAPRTDRQRGQSLVELALTTPILLLIMAGTLEVTNMITLYNELLAATREAGRLAAQGAPDSNLWPVFTQALNGTAINQSSPDLVAWVVRPSINDCSAGTCNAGWANGSTTDWGISVNCINPAGCNGESSPITPDVVWNGLAKGTPSNDFSNYSNQTFAVVISSYNAPTLLNLKLNLFGAQWGRSDGKFPIYTYIVFRQEVSSQSASDLAGGCSSYPIALDFTQIPPAQYAPGAPAFPLSLSTQGFYFLAWHSTQTGSNTLTSAIAGYQPIGSLVSPGTSQPSIPTGNTGNYVNPFDGTDSQLRRGDWVPLIVPSPTTMGSAISTLLSNDIGNPTANPPVLPRTLRVIIFLKDQGVATTKAPTPTQSLGGGLFKNPGTTSSGIFAVQINDFLVVKITSVADPVVNFQYVSASDSCGYPQ